MLEYVLWDSKERWKMMFDWRFFRFWIPNLIIFSFPPGRWILFQVWIQFKFSEFPARKLVLCCVVLLLCKVNEFNHGSRNGLKFNFLFEFIFSKFTEFIQTKVFTFCLTHLLKHFTVVSLMNLKIPFMQKWKIREKF